MPANTKSTSILFDYLINRLELEEQITFDDFSEELPANVSPEVVGALYRELIRQHQHRQSTIDIPIKGLLQEASKNPEAVKGPKLEKLVGELELLQTRLAYPSIPRASDNAEIVEDALQKINKMSGALEMSL
ncbi:hypothetical protein Cantr_05739 [Candida viswanathii]|uniref:Uncharacterized protein n=1 Tax=Candida viswanathii TaxID=5486 RepID=A0A367XSV5_9ASCO|nr:hypothetical protein Cantr_05739 [Candida viswanathii]